ncbi:hypothetical protein [Streptomyces celluloflavus]|uniref:hypothetical protein n=1 Tax=Streptomyces celluloflavus TaxID=58344 RepID=UPI00346096B0|nr:hypothetical protein OG717_29735 [Streptomyces celluloflavus]
MGNRADEYGTDVEIYRKPLTAALHADTPTGAPEKLLALLDGLGLERKTVTTAGPVYVWHEVPEQLTEAEQKKLVSRAVPSLLVAGYLVNITSDVFDADAYGEAADEIRAKRAGAATASSAPAAVPPPATSAGRSRRSA